MNAWKGILVAGLLASAAPVTAQVHGRTEPGWVADVPPAGRASGASGQVHGRTEPGWVAEVPRVGRPAAPPAAARPPTQTIGRPPPIGTPPAAPAPPAHFGARRPPVDVPPPRVQVHPPPRTHVDVVIGSPWPRPWYGPRPVYPSWGWGWGWGYPYPPPVIVESLPPPPPVVYVERPVVRDDAPAAGYWYWCAAPEGWYPDVVECPPGWQPVPPRAAP